MQNGRFSWETANDQYRYQEQGAAGNGRTVNALGRQQTQLDTYTHPQSQQDAPPSQSQSQSRTQSQSQSQSQARNPRFSYSKTPALMQGSTFDTFPSSSPSATMSRPHTYIDEDPMSPQTAYEGTPPLPQLPQGLAGGDDHGDERIHAASPSVATASHSPYPEDKKSPVATSPIYQPAIPPPQEVHPAHFAPYAEDRQQVQATTPQPFTQQPYPQQQSQQYSQHVQAPHQPINVLATPTFKDPRTPPPMTYPPLPQSPVYHSTDSKKPQSPSSDDKRALPGLDFYHPDQNIFANPAVPSSPHTPIYTPSSPSPFGPRTGTGNTTGGKSGKKGGGQGHGNSGSISTAPQPGDHMPGQIAHPLSSASREWHRPLLTPSASCVTATFCPCITYGKVQYRLAQRGRRKEATDLLGYSACNGDCGLFAAATLLCGLCGILPTIQRTRTRKAYGVDGGVVADCLRGCCCCCCVLALNEDEIVHREEERKKLAGPVTTQYAAAPSMAYPS